MIPPWLERQSVPPYPHRRTYTALVLGSGPTLFEDLKRAPKDCFRVGIRLAAEMVRCDAVFSLDRAALREPKLIHEKSFGPIECHSGKPGAGATHERYPWVDYWWPEPEISNAGTSAWAAAKVLVFMGHERVILCGVPLVPGDYADGREAAHFKDMSSINLMRRRIMDDVWMRPYVRSLSGWTKEALGAPEGMAA